MPGLQSAFRMEEEVGEMLGRYRVLFGAVSSSQKEGKQPKYAYALSLKMPETLF